MPKQNSKAVPLFHLFEAPPGWVFISFDYSQAELRRLAVETQDPRLLEVYNKPGGDLHDETRRGLVDRAVFKNMGPEFVLEGNESQIAHALDMQRRFAKTLNFGIPYGMGGRTYAKRNGMWHTVTRDKWGRPVAPRKEPDDRQGQQFVDAWYAKYAGVRPWQERQIAFAEEHGYVTTLEGRPMWVPGIFAEYSQIRHHAEKQCGNYPIQGGVAEIVKDAMIRCPDYLVLQVHDELLYLVPEEIAQAYFDYLSEALVDNRHEIPYIVDGHLGRSWGDLKNLEDLWVDSDDDDEV